MGDDFPIFSPNFGKPDEKKEEQPVRKVGKRPELAAPYAEGSPSIGYPGVAPAGAIPDLRAWRVARGWSQFEFAKRLGKSLSTTIRWETQGIPALKRAWLVNRLRELESEEA